MENRIDFVNWLDPDMSIQILTCLDDLSDLLRVTCVSRCWRQYVIANGLCRQLCLRMFPQLSKVVHVVEQRYGTKDPAEVGSSNFMEWQNLEREHRAYAFLARGCTTFPIRDLISEPICASSTDNYPEESIDNTLEPRDVVAQRASYWSSKGNSNPAEPEMLLYKLMGDLCVITEVSIQPFEAYFQWGLPIYSAKAVRFRMGHPKSPVDVPLGESYKDYENKFIWTYTSQEFPMAQEPDNSVIAGGALWHIPAIMGRSLSPAFGIESPEPSGKFALKVLSYAQPTLDDPSLIQSAYLRRRVGQIINILRGNAVDVVEYEWGEEDDESDDEFVL
ncbi:F-box protein [Citrus sinensis]|uniref:F-box protein n=1 Tax=Citrus sinensis TaxID=2711 RepID=A0ACB8MR86_CITSI|nr:F-box protein [Citrus sinensis]